MSYFDCTEMIERTNCASARLIRPDVTVVEPNVFAKDSSKRFNGEAIGERFERHAHFH